MHWNELPRTRDKVAIVGFSETTRALAPYDNPEYEIWGLNEEYHYPWMKRFDRWFQLHPRWDYSRTNNLNDPNHFAWLQNIEGVCSFCKGVGKMPNQPEQDCMFCDHGYFKPISREGVPVYMQEAWDDIPGSITYPLEEITARFIPHLGYQYYTSSPVYMLAMAMMLDFKEIELYGFEMGSNTEYHYQRACFEYWIGLAQGLGYKVSLPSAKNILQGKLYGYENMQTGYRQQLEMRAAFLANQLKDETAKRLKLEGRVEATKDLDAPVEKLQVEVAKYSKQLGLVQTVEGALHETENLTKLYDSYFRGNEDDEQAASQKHTTAAYAKN